MFWAHVEGQLKVGKCLLWNAKVQQPTATSKLGWDKSMLCVMSWLWVQELLHGPELSDVEGFQNLQSHHLSCGNIFRGFRDRRVGTENPIGDKYSNTTTYFQTFAIWWDGPSSAGCLSQIWLNRPLFKGLEIFFWLGVRKSCSVHLRALQVHKADGSW